MSKSKPFDTIPVPKDSKYISGSAILIKDTIAFKCRQHPKNGKTVGSIEIVYHPDKEIIELDSFHEYIASYIDKTMYLEEVADKILDDVVRTVKPLFVKLDLCVEGLIHRTTCISMFSTSIDKNDR